MKTTATKNGLLVSLRFEGLTWTSGRRNIRPEELKVIKKIPASMAIIKNGTGEILNPEKAAPAKAKPKAKKATKKPTKPKEKKDEKAIDNHGKSSQEISDPGD